MSLDSCAKHEVCQEHQLLAAGSDDPAAQFNYETVENRDPADKMDQPPPLINGFFPGGLYQLNWPEGYEQNAKLTYRNDTPFPATVVGMYPDVGSAD